MATRVTFSHRPDQRPNLAPLDEEREARPLAAGETLPLEPIERPEASHTLMRSYYDDQTNQTFSIAVSARGEKRYLALTEADWQAMLPALRNLQMTLYQNPLFSVIDLSSGFYTASGEDEGVFNLISHQIRSDDPEHTGRYDALASIREYLVQKKYVQNLSKSTGSEYEVTDQGRACFAVKKVLEQDDTTEATKRAEDIEKAHRLAGIRNEQEGALNHNFELVTVQERVNRLDAFLDAKRAELLDQHGALVQELNRGIGGRALETLTPIELQHRSNMRHEIKTINEKLAALSHRAELKTAMALSCEEAEDHLSILRAACDARATLCRDLEHVEAPRSLQDEARLQKATDIASLLIPTSGGDERHNLMSLFYGGTMTLRSLVTDSEDPGQGHLMAPVILPESTGHLYLREILTEYRTTPPEAPAMELD